MQVRLIAPAIPAHTDHQWATIETNAHCTRVFVGIADQKTLLEDATLTSCYHNLQGAGGISHFGLHPPTLVFVTGWYASVPTKKETRLCARLYEACLALKAKLGTRSPQNYAFMLGGRC